MSDEAAAISGPFKLGLTGSIGMGKSTVAAMFAKLGVPVFEADRLVHEFQGPGGKLLPTIEEAFPGTTGPEGLDRARMRAIVFEDPQARKKLEAIVHPAVYDARSQFLTEHAEAPLVVFDIPLLFETGRAHEMDGIAVVSAPEDVQRQRVLARPGMTAERFAQILDAQVPDADKRRGGDHVIDTGCSLAETRQAVAELVDKLSG